jgi:biotin carboxyl carrier protein
MGATGVVGTSAPASAASVKAPMPGRIVRVLVGVGDRVAARQPVVVVEAMKMENELRSPRDGVVTQVLVTPGAAVESGAVLIVVGS